MKSNSGFILEANKTDYSLPSHLSVCLSNFVHPFSFILTSLLQPIYLFRPLLSLLLPIAYNYHLFLQPFFSPHCFLLLLARVLKSLVRIQSLCIHHFRQKTPKEHLLSFMEINLSVLPSRCSPLQRLTDYSFLPLEKCLFVKLSQDIK